MSNFGHLLINVLNPLFVYTYFVHENITSLKNESVTPNLLPLPNTLILFKVTVDNEESLAHKKPTFLFDLALRFSSAHGEMDKYFKSRLLGVHCFKSFSMPIFLPSRKNQEWDAMHFSLKGRWGRDDTYFNFWRENKQQIFQLYNISQPVREPSQWKNLTMMRHKPKMLYMEREGGTKRSDSNVARLAPYFSKYFDFRIMNGGYYKWHLSSDLRYNLTRNTLVELNSGDIALGLPGSNMQGALFMQENTMLIDIKTAFTFCNNEGGKHIANHNRLSFYQANAKVMSQATRVGISFDLDKMPAFAKEISDKWAIEVVANREDVVTRSDEWRSECTFLWVDQDPLMISRHKMLTRSDQSRCYLDNLQGTYGWYQLTVRNNRENCQVNNEISLDFRVHCFRKELC
jgi:hypothetical protein